MNAVMTYPSLFEQAMNMNAEKIEEIKKLISHYKRLNMPNELIEQTKRGAISILLKTLGFQMLRGSVWRNVWKIFKVEEDGTDDQKQLWWDRKTSNGSVWCLTKLKDFDRPVPIEILETLDDKASEVAWVFYPAPSHPDPILVYPLMFDLKTITYEDDPKWWDKDHTSQVEKIMPGPFFAGIYKW